MKKLMHLPWIVVLVVLLAGAKPSSSVALVVCAPGYPGNTEQAQPTMDAFAENVESLAGWKKGRLTATYFETAAAGVEAMKTGDAAVALVPLSLFAQQADALGLEPRLLAVPNTGPVEAWTLVAPQGTAAEPRSLDGWEVASRAGYAPEFVRGVVFDGWDLPETATIEFTTRIVSRLRKAATGENVAVLLDGEQSAALGSLSFAKDLEVVFTSKPLPAFVACTIGDRLDDKDAAALFAALLELDDEQGGADVLEQIRLVRFETLDDVRIEQIESVRERAANRK
jgi:hypothetical protein